MNQSMNQRDMFFKWLYYAGAVLLLVLVGAAGGIGYLLDKGGWPEVSRFFSQLFGKKE